MQLTNQRSELLVQMENFTEICISDKLDKNLKFAETPNNSESPVMGTSTIFGLDN